MTNTTNTAAVAAAQTNAAKWPARFGTLVDITERESAKGPYITFKMTAQPKDKAPFDVYGACFDAEIVAKMKAAVGQQIWVKGPLETRTVNGEEKRSFKVVYFNLSADRDAETAEAEAEAA
jgi:hypothetical protein